MQRGTTFSNSNDDGIDVTVKGLDTTSFLKSNGIDLDNPTRSMGGWDSGLDSGLDRWDSDLGGFGQGGLFGKRRGPTYRSIDVSLHKPSSHQFGTLSPLANDMTSWDSFDQSVLQKPGKSLFEPPKFALRTGSPATSTPPSGRRAPAFSTRPHPPLLGARVFDVDGDYDSIVVQVRKFASQEGIFDLKIDEETGFVEGSFNSERHMQDATFTLKIYEETRYKHKMEFIRRLGSAVAYGEFLARAQRSLGSGTPPLPMPMQLGEITDPMFMDINSYDINEEILEEQTDIMRNGVFEVLEHEMQVIAKTAAQDNCAEMWQGAVGEKFIEALVNTFTKATNGSVCRHSRKAITRLLDAGLELGRDAKRAVDEKIRQLGQRN